MHLVGFDAHFQLIELNALPINENLVVAGQPRMGEQNLLDLTGEDVDAAHYEHIVGTTAYT